MSAENAMSEKERAVVSRTTDDIACRLPLYPTTIQSAVWSCIGQIRHGCRPENGFEANRRTAEAAAASARDFLLMMNYSTNAPSNEPETALREWLFDRLLACAVDFMLASLPTAPKPSASFAFRGPTGVKPNVFGPHSTIQ